MILTAADHDTLTIMTYRQEYQSLHHFALLHCQPYKTISHATRSIMLHCQEYRTVSHVNLFIYVYCRQLKML